MEIADVIQVELTAEDIEKTLSSLGRTYRASAECYIATAVKRHFNMKNGVSCGYHGVHVRDVGYFWLDQNAKDITGIQPHCPSFRAVTPTTFTLTLKTKYV